MQEAAFFIGTFENKVDRKGRISVPSDFRRELEHSNFHGILAFRSRRTDAIAIEACGVELMKTLNAAQPKANLMGSGGSAPAPIFYEAQRLGFDGDGRVILPADLRAFANIETSATFVGIGDTFQIWEPERHRAYVESLRGADQ